MVQNLLKAEMYAENLIESVRERRALWDRNDAGYYDRIINNKLWTEIAEELNTTCSNAKKRWKSLRDVFRTELKKMQYQKPGEKTSGKSSWAHFQAMLFLKEQLSQRNIPAFTKALSENQSDEEATQQGSQNDSDEQSIADEDNDDPLSFPKSNASSKITIQHGNNKKRKANSAIETNFLDAEYKKVQHKCSSPEKEYDEDFHFLMSFHQPLKRMPENKKMWFRLQMQQLLCDCTVTVEPSELQNNNSNKRDNPSGSSSFVRDSKKTKL